MPKTVIEFTPDEGRLSYNKRKRMPGTKSKMQKEIKQANTAANHQGDYTAYTAYASLITKASQDGSPLMYPWRFSRLVFPGLGQANYQRIGNSFFLRSLRIKGYVSYSSRNILRPIRWRLKLYRFEGVNPYSWTTTSASAQVAQYAKLFTNWETPSDWTRFSDIISSCRHNFYKAIKKYPKEYSYHCKTIASGVIPKSNSFVATSGITYGTQNTYTLGNQVQTNNNDSGDTPIDVIVKLNDRVVIKDDIESCQYFLVLEDDFGSHIRVTEGTSNTIATWNFSDDVSYKVYSLEFWSRWYYTDD